MIIIRSRRSSLIDDCYATLRSNCSTATLLLRYATPLFEEKDNPARARRVSRCPCEECEGQTADGPEDGFRGWGR
jgi:hypothetical protein